MTAATIARFEVPGQPYGKGRARARAVGKFARIYTPEETVSYESLVKTQAGDAMAGRPPVDMPVEIIIHAFFPIPGSGSAIKKARMLAGEIRPTKKPDFDNISKVICDAINHICYRDDALIVRGLVEKFYSDRPRVEVEVKEYKTTGVLL